MAGVLLGRGWGGFSQLLYVVLGAAGVPWFAGGARGLSVLIGPSGGYFIGFILFDLLSPLSDLINRSSEILRAGFEPTTPGI